MPETNHVTPKSGDQLLLVGTMKGAFVLKSDLSRKNWEVGGPYFPGRAIYAMNYDGRDGRGRGGAALGDGEPGVADGGGGQDGLAGAGEDGGRGAVEGAPAERLRAGAARRRSPPASEP